MRRFLMAIFTALLIEAAGRVADAEAHRSCRLSWTDISEYPELVDRCNALFGRSGESDK